MDADRVSSEVKGRGHGKTQSMNSGSAAERKMFVQGPFFFFNVPQEDKFLCVCSVTEH